METPPDAEGLTTEQSLTRINNSLALPLTNVNETPSLPRFLKKTAENEITSWQTETLDNHADTSAKDWNKARAFFNRFEHLEPLTEAALYIKTYPDYPPDRFHTSGYKRKKAAEKALQPSGWATRLFKQLDYPNTPVFFYTLSITNLGLPANYSDSRFVYIPLVIAEIKAALKKKLPVPFSWKVEVGDEGTVHIHAIAGYAPALSRLEGSKRMQQVELGTESRLIAYMCKPAATFTVLNFATYLEARRDKQTKNLPQLSGQLGIKKPPRKGKE